MTCEICGRSENECKIRKIKGMYLCSKHITQYYRYGKFDDNTIYSPNEYVIYENYAEIILKDKNCKECGRAIIDIEDVEKCKKFKWHMRKSKGNTFYVISSIKGMLNQKIHLHRYIVNYYGSLDIDHINMNGLDNRKENLRIVSRSVNKSNNKSTGIKLVKSGRYQASCCRSYKTYYIGTYDTFDEAAKARADFVSNII